MNYRDAFPTHDFAQSLDRSYELVETGWWDPFYREAFPAYRSIVAICRDGQEQRLGIDRIVTLPFGVIKIDEKARFKDYGDVLLEEWSDLKRRTPGWIKKDLAIDCVAYAVVPAHKVFLLPFEILQHAWRLHGEEWRATYGTVIAQNKGYLTESVIVPVRVLRDAIGEFRVLTGSA